MAPPLRPLLAWAFGLAVAAAASGEGRRGLSRFTLAELQALEPPARARLRRVLRAEGAVLLTDVPGYSGTAAEALDALGDCFRNLEAFGERKPVVSPSLLSGGIERWTLAASTRAGSPEPLPDWARGACPGLAGRAERLRSFVSLILLSFARSADEVASVDPQASSSRRASAALLEPAGARLQRAGLEELVRRGTLLEHFHRYQQSAQQTDVAARQHPLTMHTDAGLLQALSVRWRASGLATPKAAAVHLEVELPGGLVVPAEEEVASGTLEVGAGEKAGGLLLLLGQASQEWLPHLRLRAAPHALSSHPSPGALAERLVYGVMVLPPDDWPLVSAEQGNATFGEWWRRAQLAVGEGKEGRLSQSQGAELEPMDMDSGQGCLSAGLLQRKLQDQAHTCPAGSMYCWMQCQVVPASLPCKADWAVCMSSTTGKICPDDGTHDASCKPACPAGGSFSFEIKSAGEPDVIGGYRSNGWTGSKRSYVKPPAVAAAPRAQVAWDDYWASDHFGHWVLFIPGYKSGSALYYVDSEEESPPESGWQAASGALPLPVLDFNSSHGDGPEPLGAGFCNGVLTDMHMLGFTWSGEENPCLIFLFHGWELTDSMRFWGATVVTILAGIFAEWLVALRRWEVAWKPLPKGPGGRWNPRRVSRQAGRLLLYALTRSTGYMVMLVTMTYSAELFMAVIVGLSIGHACFNMASPPGEDMTPCCQAGRECGGERPAVQAGQDVVVGRSAQVADGALRLRFKVTGMTCDACCGTVSRAVQSLSFVQAVSELSSAAGSLEVVIFSSCVKRGNERELAERVSNAVEEVGFGATLLDLVERGGSGIVDDSNHTGGSVSRTAEGGAESEAPSGCVLTTPLIPGR